MNIFQSIVSIVMGPRIPRERFSVNRGRRRSKTASFRWASIALWFVCAMVGIAHAGTVTYVYTDPQGTPLAEADASGNVTARFDYAPYGGQALGTPPSGPGYTGHVNDPDTGLVYMQARYYDPAVGRFLSTDPVAPSPGNLFNFNRYNYTSNNPINHTDPDGRCSDADGSCGRMARAFGNDPALTESMAPVRNVLGAAMLTASGFGVVVEAAGMVRTAQMIDKVLSESAAPSKGKTFTTYTREKPDGRVYSGRTSGKAAPEGQVANRISRGRDHQAKTVEGYGPAKVDKNSSNPDAIRGREQQLIEQNGGARSQGGTSGNTINGVSPTNSKGPDYRAACAKEFGC